MDSKINLSQLTDLFAQASGMSRTASEQFVKTFFEIIADRVLSEGLVKVKGFGTFKLLKMEDRESVNVNTGERFTIEGHQKISFTPDAELKDSINKPFASFETVEITKEQEKTLAAMEPTEKVVEEPKEQVEEKSEPKVREVTQKRFWRFLLGFLAWILSLVLVIILLYILLWPSLGNRILDYIDQAETTRISSVKTIERDTIAAVRLQREQELKVQTSEQPAVQQSVPQTVQPKTATKAEPNAKPAAREVIEQNVGLTQIFLMDEYDMERDLSTFSSADTVKYIISGYLASHVLQPGETLTKISLQYYGTKKLWPYIAAYNGISDFSHLDPGTTIRVPKIAYRNRGNR